MVEALWPGPFRSEAVKAYQRAVSSGMRPLRSLVIGCVASFRDCWAFQRHLATRLGCSIRTIQRGLRQGRQLGLIECHRAKRGEKAPGVGAPVDCGWSHRWAIGWGEASEVAERACTVARLGKMIPGVKRASKPTPAVPRRWTATEIEAELARRDALARARPPPAD
jgi:hypothetical protein